jgi:hypothetical protein
MRDEPHPAIVPVPRSRREPGPAAVGASEVAPADGDSQLTLLD